MLLLLLTDTLWPVLYITAGLTANTNWWHFFLCSARIHHLVSAACSLLLDHTISTHSIHVLLFITRKTGFAWEKTVEKQAFVKSYIRVQKTRRLWLFRLTNEWSAVFWFHLFSIGPVCQVPQQKGTNWTVVLVHPHLLTMETQSLMKWNELNWTSWWKWGLRA